MYTVIDDKSGCEVFCGVKTMHNLVLELGDYQRRVKPDVGLRACAGVFRADEYETHPNWKVDIASCVGVRYTTETSTGCPYLPRLGTTRVEMPFPTLYPLGSKLWGYAIHLYGAHELRQAMDLVGNISLLEAISIYCDDIGLILTPTHYLIRR